MTSNNRTPLTPDGISFTGSLAECAPLSGAEAAVLTMEADNQTLRRVAAVYGMLLLLIAALNYVPAIRDQDGAIFGIFAPDFFDNMLHLASVVWAFAASLSGARASRHFLTWFGLIYLLDGIMGLVTGSGYLGPGIFLYGFQDLDLHIRLAANSPHMLLGGIARFFGPRHGVPRIVFVLPTELVSASGHRNR
jgi:hypothetical protein